MASEASDPRSHRERRAALRPASRVGAAAFAAGVLVSSVLSSVDANVGGATLAVVDARGRPVPDAAVWLEPLDAKSAGAAAAAARTASIAQREKRFDPTLTVVQSGTAVSFPNEDTVRHHVYSFSPAKTFELKLYAGRPPSPVVFEKAGTVVLGCNIHDRMVAWVQVVDTPWFGRSDESGRARIAGVPPGEYRLRAFHPEQLDAPPERRVRIGADETVAVAIELRPGAGRP
ncbi:MAG TPA: methylamine utilization protein [Burkholderiaceae bacterium]|nr:methylamine utilization protein [Burkholderiaceae bacterium]